MSHGIYSGGAVVALSPADKFESFGSSDNIAAAQGSLVTFANTGGYNTATFQLTVPLGGTIEFQGSFDGGITFAPCTMRGIDIDSYTQRAIQSGPHIGSIAGMTHFRFYVNVGGTTTGTVIGRATKEVSTLEGQELPPPSDFLFDISRGRFRNTTSLHKFGRNGDVDILAEETIWHAGGLYTFSSGSNETWHASSTSTSDTTVKLYSECLDVAFRPINQTVTLNGQTAVALSGTLFRINSAFITGTVQPVGNVYIYKSGGGITAGVPNSTIDIRAFLDPTDNQALSTVFTVPSGTVAFMQDFHAEASVGNVDLRLRTRESGSLFRTRNRVNVNAGAGIIIDFNSYLALPSKSDIKFDASTSANNTVVSVQYDMILVSEI